MKTLVIWCLVFQAIILIGNAVDSGDVRFSVLIRNEMYKFKNPAVFYHCRSSKKDLGWRKSVPSSEFQWYFKVPEFGNGVVIHNCHFRSRIGTANITIKVLSTTAILCDGQTCKYAVRPNGIYFIGYELYSPSSLFASFLEFSRPVEKLVEPWELWSPQQLKAIHHRKQDDDED